MLTGRWWAARRSSPPVDAIRPLLGCAKPASIRSRVVLPQPEAPTSANISPCNVERDVVDRCVVPKFLLTPSMRICAVARGSSHGCRRAVSTGSSSWPLRLSEVRRRRGVPPLRGHRRAARPRAPAPCGAPTRAHDSGKSPPTPWSRWQCRVASTIASARFRLQVGDQVAEVTLPASFLPDRAV